MRATHTAMGIFALTFTTLAAAAEPAAKPEKQPAIGCDRIVETYKANHSVDETAAALYVDQSRVAQCLKAAGINPPLENNR